MWVADSERPGAEDLVAAPANQLKQPDLAKRLEGLRGMAWAYGVLHHTGYSASGASKRFSPPVESEQDQANSKIMYQYLRGDRAPTRGARGKYGFDLVAAVDKHPQGKLATKWLDHPLWLIFDPKTKGDELEPFLEEDFFPPALAEFVLAADLPPQTELTSQQLEALELEIFDDFVAVCAFCRGSHMAGYRPLGIGLLEHLLPQAGSIEPVFGYIQAPFLKMVQDFYKRAA